MKAKFGRTLFQIGTLLALAAAIATAQVPERYRDAQRGERRDTGRPRSRSRAEAADPIGAQYEARVVGVTDGDTIRVLHNGREVRIRLYGIDCPESRQAFGTRAKQFTAELAFGQRVTVRVRDIDRYCRTVADVTLENGRSLNRELVSAGLA